LSFGFGGSPDESPGEQFGFADHGISTEANSGAVDASRSEITAWAAGCGPIEFS
jgi:hypothetical protein